MDKIRCPACRGSKKVAKLGGMIGECNTCAGSGEINSSDKPVPVIAASLPMTDSIIKATADCVPVTTLELKQDTKIDPKRAIYRKKKA